MTATFKPRLLDYLDHIDQALDLMAAQIVSQCSEEDFVAGRCPVHESAAMYQVAKIGEIAA